MGRLKSQLGSGVISMATAKKPPPKGGKGKPNPFAKKGEKPGDKKKPPPYKKK